MVAVALVHTTLALPTTMLIMSSIFLAVPVDLEEAAWTLGCTPVGAFTRVVLPLALPGIAAASIFTFVLSWNEVFAASILTVQTHTLPAQVLASLNESSLPVPLRRRLRADPAVADLHLHHPPLSAQHVGPRRQMSRTDG